MNELNPMRYKNGDKLKFNIGIKILYWINYTWNI